MKMIPKHHGHLGDDAISHPRASRNNELSNPEPLSPIHGEIPSDSVTVTSTTSTSGAFPSSSERATTLSFRNSGQKQPSNPEANFVQQSRLDGKLGASSFTETKESPVFELLQSRFADENLEPTTEEISAWVSDMKIAPDASRLEHFSSLLSHIDDILTPSRNEGIKTCAPRRSNDRATSGDGRKRTSREKGINPFARGGKHRAESSRKSDNGSEGSSIPTNPGPNPGGTILQFPRLFSCPFVKRDPDRYILVSNSCTERWGFPNPGKLVEHLKRVHSLKVPCCMTCKQRFSGRTRSHAEQAGFAHENARQCVPRELMLLEPEWMTEAQDARFSNSVIQGQTSCAEEKWRSIYRLLFDLQEEEVIPDPYYDFLIPRHLSNIDTRNSMTAHGQGESMFGSRNRASTQPLLSTAFHGTPYDWASGENGGSRYLPTPAQHQSHPIDPILGDSTSNSVNDTGHTPTVYQDSQQYFSINPRVFLTSTSLQLNEQSQPAEAFDYGLREHHDSGYRSLGQASGVETAVPVSYAKAHQHDSDDAIHDERGPDLIPSDDLDLFGSNQDLAGLEIDTRQFPDSVQLDDYEKGKAKQTEDV